MIEFDSATRYPVLEVTPETTAQDVYNAVVRHLREQGGLCMNPDEECDNRNSAGHACALASLISDKENELVEGCPLTDPLRKAVHREAPERLRAFDARYPGFLHALRQAHDFPRNVNQRLLAVADEWGLTPHVHPLGF